VNGASSFTSGLDPEISCVYCALTSLEIFQFPSSSSPKQRRNACTMNKTSNRFSSPAPTISDSPIDTCKTIRRSSSMPAPLPRDGQIKQCKAAFRTAAKNIIKSVDKLIAPKSTSPNLLMKLPVELRMKVWRFYLIISGPVKNKHFQSLSDILLPPLLLSRHPPPEIREVLWGDNAIFIHVTYKFSPLSAYLWLPPPTVLPLIKYVVIDLTPSYNEETDFFSNETMDIINTWNNIGCRYLSTQANCTE